MAGTRITQLAPHATPTRRYGSFAGRVPAPAPEVAEAAAAAVVGAPSVRIGPAIYFETGVLYLEPWQFHASDRFIRPETVTVPWRLKAKVFVADRYVEGAVLVLAEPAFSATHRFVSREVAAMESQAEWLTEDAYGMELYRRRLVEMNDRILGIDV